jgi:ClpP class serine protease
VKLTKTKDFITLEQLTSFIVTHLYELYDSKAELEKEYGEDSIYVDYVIGSIDTTQVYLYKAGVKFLEETDYIEKVNDPNWKRD